MSYADHDHRGDYADQRHDHDGDYAEMHHRHYDLEREDERLQGGLREAMAQVDLLRRELEDQLRDAFERIRALEGRQPDYAADEPPGPGVLASYAPMDRHDDPPAPDDLEPFAYQSEEVAEAFTEWCAAGGVEARDDQEYRWLRQAFTAGMNEVARYGAAGLAAATGADPDRPETWAFGEPPLTACPDHEEPGPAAGTFTCCTTPMPWPARDQDRTCPDCGTIWEREPIDIGAGARIKSAGCAETSDGEHCGDWRDGGRCGACGLYGPDPEAIL